MKTNSEYLDSISRRKNLKFLIPRSIWDRPSGYAWNFPECLTNGWRTHCQWRTNHRIYPSLEKIAERAVLPDFITYGSYELLFCTYQQYGLAWQLKKLLGIKTHRKEWIMMRVMIMDLPYYRSFGMQLYIGSGLGWFGTGFTYVYQFRELMRFMRENLWRLTTNMGRVGGIWKFRSRFLIWSGSDLGTHLEKVWAVAQEIEFSWIGRSIQGLWVLNAFELWIQVPIWGLVGWIMTYV